MHLVVLLLFLFIPSYAHAYIDPGLGSLFIQGLIATIAVFTTSIAIYFKKIKNFYLEFLK